MSRVDGWVKRSVRVKMVGRLSPEHEEMVDREAEVLGSLAVHQFDGSWDVTHVPTGLRVTTVGSMVAAKKIAVSLMDVCGPLLRDYDPDEFVRRKLTWVARWMRRCAIVGRWVLPGEFCAPAEAAEAASVTFGSVDL